MNGGRTEVGGSAITPTEGRNPTARNCYAIAATSSLPELQLQNTGSPKVIGKLLHPYYELLPSNLQKDMNSYSALKQQVLKAA